MLPSVDGITLELWSTVKVFVGLKDVTFSSAGIVIFFSSGLDSLNEVVETALFFLRIISVASEMVHKYYNKISHMFGWVIQT